MAVVRISQFKSKSFKILQRKLKKFLPPKYTSDSLEVLGLSWPGPHAEFLWSYTVIRLKCFTPLRSKNFIMTLNAFTPMSDKDIISPYSINTKLNNR